MNDRKHCYAQLLIDLSVLLQCDRLFESMLENHLQRTCSFIAQVSETSVWHSCSIASVTEKENVQEMGYSIWERTHTNTFVLFQKDTRTQNWIKIYSRSRTRRCHQKLCERINMYDWLLFHFGATSDLPEPVFGFLYNRFCLCLLFPGRRRHRCPESCQIWAIVFAVNVSLLLFVLFEMQFWAVLLHVMQFPIRQNTYKEEWNKNVTNVLCIVYHLMRDCVRSQPLLT